MWIWSVESAMPAPVGPRYILVLNLTAALCILSLLSPPTPTWKLIRASIFAPIAIYGFYQLGYTHRQKDWEETWGTNLFMTSWMLRVLELLVFLPAEENVYRLVGYDRNSNSDIICEQAARNGNVGEIAVPRNVMVREPVPPPWTMKKVYWSTNLWFSLRGIGWNYTCTLPSNSLRHPYSHTSPWRDYLTYRLRYYLLAILLHDASRSYMNLSPAHPFFGGLPNARTYTQLSQVDRAVYSLAIAIRVWFSLEKTNVALGLMCVSMGGVMGWEGEFWSPWGWPPLFGGWRDLWEFPGLSHMWSKTWHQYFRRWLYVFGWVGIGEKILGLPASGPTLRARSHSDNHIATTFHAKRPELSSNASDLTTPNHPLPSSPAAATSPKPRRFAPPIMLSNLLKSLIVFAITGWIHDNSSYLLLLTRHKLHGTPVPTLKSALATTPFFVIQPVGLAIEATWKRVWRGWKAKKGWYKAGKTQGEPKWLVHLERILGFIWTWTWLGWTAGWFVQGLGGLGIYRRDEGQPLMGSLVGGLVWGKWKH